MMMINIFGKNEEVISTHNDGVIEQLIGAGILRFTRVQSIQFLQSGDLDRLEHDVQKPVRKKQLYNRLNSRHIILF